MSHRIIPTLATCCFFLVFSLPTKAASIDFDAVYARALATEKKALALESSWSTTQKTLAEAMKEHKANNDAKAVVLAQEAEALAKASIEQGVESDHNWQNAVIR